MYARGLTTRQISEQIEEIYGFECSENFISDVTDKVLQDIEDWQNRPLDDIYPILFIDAVHFSVRDDNIIRKLAAYVIMGINCDGMKDVISLEIGENESSKYWLGVLNRLKNRGVKDVMVVFSGKQCTEYGISSTAARMASVVLLDEKQILPVATRLEGEIGRAHV